ncbi:hypothetical protein Mal35_24520 [Gimesia maris]|uniref:hypothetical protein n=1 Tax=Gimesia maris TaxID=122 RepID=UPI00118CC12E|nr:hypothetical protein [Gimesia maris]QDT78999.1 hypothetical protein Mal35_24520 [Gimesia maris]
MSSYISTVLDFLGWGNLSEVDTSPYSVSDVYRGLREQAFGFKPDELGIRKSDSKNTVWGLLMESGEKVAVVSLLTLRDGTVSLYISHGGAIMGLGQHEVPQRVSQELLELAPQFLEDFKPVTEFPLPVPGRTKMYLFTFEEVLVFDTKLDEMGYNLLFESPLYHKAQELMNVICSIDEIRNTETAFHTEDI